MVLANIEWIGTLCTALTLACAVQLIITGLLEFCIPEVLLLTQSHMSTAAGLVAGFITLPNALRLKTAQISPNMDRIYGYTLCYQRLAICVSGTLHLTAIILAVIALITTKHLGDDFIKLMKSYHVKHSSKALVDNIQYVLQCCGGYSYEDWYKTDWDGAHIYNAGTRNKNFIRELLREDTDAYPDLVISRYDSVPFSCCARSTLAPCVHQNLLLLGLFTINRVGCGVKLRIAIETMLWFQFTIYSVCFALEVAVLTLLEGPPENLGSLNDMEDGVRPFKSRSTWGRFSNETRSHETRSHETRSHETRSHAILMPSSHSEITLKSSY